MQTNPVAALSQRVIAAFQRRCGMSVPVCIHENPTEEIVEAHLSGKAIKLFARGGVQHLSGDGGAKARLEENYLFDTRRFPAAVDNTLGAGAIAQGDSPYFSLAVGQNGATNGFPNNFAMSQTETNMDTPNEIAQGKNFVLWQIGVSFNAEASRDNVSQLMDAGSLRFEKQGGQFTLRHGPVRLWPGGTGVAGFTSATNSESAHNGSADIRATRRLSVPRVLRQKETFAYQYSVPRTTRATDGTVWALSAFTLMTIWLWGGQQDTIPV